MQKGDIVRWDYQGWIVGAKPEQDELFETTLETLAKEKDIHKEGALYGPAPLIIGAGRLVKGLEASLLAAEAYWLCIVSADFRIVYQAGKQVDPSHFGMIS